MRRLAERDPLTGLLNRRAFQERLDGYLENHRSDGTQFALLMLDLDGFKEINDTLGHGCGDMVLVEIGRKLSLLLRDGDTLARLGGDEFAILVAAGAKGCEPTERAAARRIEQALENPILVSGLPLRVQASVGIACCPADGTNANLLLQRSDIALYHAKKSAQAHSRYDERRDTRDPRRLLLLAELQGALESDELVLHYQPKVNLRTGNVERLEALVRWQHPSRGLLPPAEFIPAAEQTTLIGPLTLWVVDQALADQGRWRAAGLQVDIAVNLSHRNLGDPTLAEQVQALLARHHNDRILFEITESALADDPERAEEQLRQLHQLGVELALDDFGSGNTSLAFLSRYPLRQVKIDRCFISNLETNPAHQAIVRATINLAHELGLEVVAEGIEQSETEQVLKRIGCDLGQGFLYTQPLPAEQIQAWINGRRRLSIVA